MQMPLKRWKIIRTAGSNQRKNRKIKIDLGVVWRTLSTKISSSIVERNWMTKSVKSMAELNSSNKKRKN